MRIRLVLGVLLTGALLAFAQVGIAQARGDIPELRMSAACWWQAGDSPTIRLSDPLVVSLYAINDSSTEITPQVNELRWTDTEDTFVVNVAPPATFEADAVEEMVVTVTPAQGTALEGKDAVVWRVGNTDPADHPATVSMIQNIDKCPEQPLPAQGSTGAALVITIVVPVVLGVGFVAWWARRRSRVS